MPKDILKQTKQLTTLVYFGDISYMQGFTAPNI